MGRLGTTVLALVRILLLLALAQPHQIAHAPLVDALEGGLRLGEMASNLTSTLWSRGQGTSVVLAAPLVDGVVDLQDSGLQGGDHQERRRPACVEAFEHVVYGGLANVEP